MTGPTTASGPLHNDVRNAGEARIEGAPKARRVTVFHFAHSKMNHDPPGPMGVPSRSHAYMTHTCPS